MKKSLICAVIGLSGIPAFLSYVIFLSQYLSAELNTILVLGFICGWGFAIAIPAKHFEEQEKKSSLIDRMEE